MADIHASGGVGAAGCKFLWDLIFNDAANTVTITATHTHFDGSPAPDPQQADLTIVLNTSVNVTISCLTGKFVAPSPAQLIGDDFSQGSPGPMLNAGAKTRTGVTLKVSADRAAALSFTNQYTPPA